MDRCWLKEHGARSHRGCPGPTSSLRVFIFRSSTRSHGGDGRTISQGFGYDRQNSCTPFYVGLDPLFALIPGTGDMLANLIGTAILVLAARLQVPQIVIARMSLNLLINGRSAPSPLSATSSPSGFGVTREMQNYYGGLRLNRIEKRSRPGFMWPASSAELSCFCCSPLQRSYGLS